MPFSRPAGVPMPPRPATALRSPALPRIAGWLPRAVGALLRGEAASRLRIWLGMLLERISEPPPRLPL